MRRTFVLVALAAVVVTGTLIAADQPKVTAKICTAVKDRAPVGEGDSFPASVGELYCFTEVVNGSGNIVHAWFHGEKEVRTMELPVKAARWRTWSAKTISPSMAGDWHVDVRDSAGVVLATVKFTIK
ncbi:MAG: DUF2914 domain-containing protein [Thermoanaerobaculaceae bacterium]|jgi:hypothetical protein